MQNYCNLQFKTSGFQFYQVEQDLRWYEAHNGRYCFSMETRLVTGPEMAPLGVRLPGVSCEAYDHGGARSGGRA